MPEKRDMIRFLAGAFWSDGRVPGGKWIKTAESDRRVLADSAVFFLFSVHARRTSDQFPELLRKVTRTGKPTGKRDIRHGKTGGEKFFRSQKQAFFQQIFHGRAVEILTKQSLADTGTDVDDRGQFFDGKILFQMGIDPGQQLFDPFLLKCGRTVRGQPLHLLRGKEQNAGECGADLEFIARCLLFAGGKSLIKIQKKGLVFRKSVKFQISRAVFQERADIAGIKNTSGQAGNDACIKDKRMIKAGGRDQTGKGVEDAGIDEAAFTGENFKGFFPDADPDASLQKEKNFQLPVPVGGDQTSRIAVDVSLIRVKVKGGVFQFIDFFFVRIHRNKGAVFDHA